MSDHEFWNELGNLYLMNEAYEPAIHAYMRSIQLNDKFGRSYGNLALAFVHTGKYEEAIKLYRRSIELLPDIKEKAIAWNRLGILYRQIKDYRNALDAYQQADILDPQQCNAKIDIDINSKLPLTVSMPCFDLNFVLAKGGSFQKIDSKLVIVKAQNESPWSDGDLILLDPEKISREMEVEKQKIESPLKEKSEQNPAYKIEEAYSETSLILEYKQNLQNKEMIINFQSDKIPENKAESKQNEQFIENFQIMETVKSGCEDMIESEVVEAADPLFELSPTELRLIELDIAKFKEETVNNPRNILAWEALGDACKSAGMYKEAIQAFKTAININSTKPTYYYRLGLIYAAERRETEAIQAFEKVLELNPDHALAHASLGSHYLKIGMDEIAQAHIKQALNTHFEQENEYNRACLEAICGNTDNALELLKIALQTKQTYITWAKNDPDLDSLHDDLRFKTLLSTYAINV